MNKFVACLVLSALLMAFTGVEASRKGGDIIVLGGNGFGGGGFGGMPAIISQGDKKRGSILFLGRKRRSVDAVQQQEETQPQYTVYRLVNSQ